MQQYQAYPSAQQRAEVVNAFMRGVYGWMTAGLGVTAGLAFLVATTPALAQIVWGNQILLLGMLFGQLGLVIAISA